MVHFSRRRFLKGSSTAAAVTATTASLIRVDGAQAGQVEQAKKSAQVRYKRRPRGDTGVAATQVGTIGAKTDDPARVGIDDTKDALP